MFNATEWLEEEITVSHECGGEETMPRHRRLAFLVYANGGFTVRGWGFLSWNGGHQSGLEQDDALALMELGAYMYGATDAGVDLFEAFKPYFDAYVAAVQAPQLEPR